MSLMVTTTTGGGGRVQQQQFPAGREDVVVASNRLEDLRLKQLALKSQIRSHHEDIEVNIAILQQVRSELSIASNLTNVSTPLSAERVEELAQRAADASRSIKNSLQHLQSCDQELIRLSTEPQQYGQAKRFQDITSSLITRHTNISTAVNNMLHARRIELLLQKHKDHRDDDGDEEAINGGSGGLGRENHQSLSAQQYLMREKSALNSTIDVIAESIATAKASYANISNQSSRLRGVGRTAGQIVGQIKQLDTLMTRIKHLKLKQQIILLTVFVLCLTLTFIYIHAQLIRSAPS